MKLPRPHIAPTARWRLALLALVALLFGPPAVAAPVPLSSVIGPPVVGTWRTQNGTEVTIAPCGVQLCGTLSYIVIPKKNAAQCNATDPQTFAALMLDYNNPDKSLQTRPLLGLTMLKIAASGDPNTYSAIVYNPEDGSTNDVQLFVIDGGATLRIGGGCLAGMCAVTQGWPRVPDRPDAPTFTCNGGQ